LPSVVSISTTLTAFFAICPTLSVPEATFVTLGAATEAFFVA
jgi:hypothetical protein